MAKKKFQRPVKAVPKKIEPAPMMEMEQEPAPENEVPEGEAPELEEETPEEEAAPGEESPEEDDGIGAPSEPLSPGEERMVKAAIEAVANLLYKNKKVGMAAMELVREPPHDKQIAQAVMMLIKAVKKSGVYIPDHLLTGIALKVLEMVMDLGMEVQMLPPAGDEELVQRAVEATLKAVAESAGLKPNQAFQPQQRPAGAGLLGQEITR